jgi:hypothetical protein
MSFSQANLPSQGTKNACIAAVGRNHAHPSRPDGYRQSWHLFRKRGGEGAATQRTAETRRKLLKSAEQMKGGVDGTLDAGELLMIGKWPHDHMGGGAKQLRHPQQGSQQENEGSEAKPISVWA